MRIPGTPRTVLRYGTGEPRGSGGSNSTRSPSCQRLAEQREGGIAPGFVRPARVDMHARDGNQPQRRQQRSSRPGRYGAGAGGRPSGAKLRAPARSPSVPPVRSGPWVRPPRQELRKHRLNPATSRPARRQPPRAQAAARRHDAPWATWASAASSAAPQARTSSARLSFACRAGRVCGGHLAETDARRCAEAVRTQQAAPWPPRPSPQSAPESSTADTVTGQLDPFRPMSAFAGIRTIRSGNRRDATLPLLLRPGEGPEAGEPAARRPCPAESSECAASAAGTRYRPSARGGPDPGSMHDPGARPRPPSG